MQLLRAVAALLVLLYHLVTTSAFGWQDAEGPANPLAAIIEAVGFAGVDLFFVISGCVMVVTCFDRLGQPRESFPFLLRRAARIYPLYWVMTALVVAVAVLRPEWLARDKLNADTLAKSLTLWPQRDYPIVAVAWTLTYEMYFYAVFAILIALPRRWFAPSLAMWTVAIAALYLWHDGVSGQISTTGLFHVPIYASPLTLEFIAGCVVGWLIVHGVMSEAAISLASGLIVFLAGGAYLRSFYLAEATSDFFRVGVFGLSSAMVLYGAVGLELNNRFRPPRWMVYWGDASYSTYLTHWYVILLTARVAPAVLPALQAPRWMATVVCLIACAVVAAICHQRVDQPLQRFARAALKRRRREVAQGAPSPHSL